jgi:hypothetical protein
MNIDEWNEDKNWKEIKWHDYEIAPHLSSLIFAVLHQLLLAINVAFKELTALITLAQHQYYQNQ